jgi:hypothetical protein
MLVNSRLLVFAMLSSLIVGCGVDNSGQSEDSETTDNNGSESEHGSDTESDSEPQTPLPITPGVGIGDFVLGKTYAEIRAVFGGQASDGLTFNRMSSVSFSEQKVDAFFLSSQDSVLSDDAILVAVGANQGGAFTGTVIPGMTKTSIDAADTDPKESGAKYTFYPKGYSVQYENDIATVVGVFAPYTLAYEPPPMEPAKTNR